ncbi:MAG: YcxB family protein [Lachnospiraceae bacterium]|nr:YcxB family protein [Lachnospiraceae bacterium]
MEKEIKASVTVNGKDLFCFMLQHTYRCVGGVLSLLFSLGAFVLLLKCFTTVDTAYKIILILSSLLFTVINPFLLYRRSMKQVKRNPAFTAPIEYTFTEKGFTMQQGEEKAGADWKDLWKVRDGKHYLYLYGNTVRANIIPKSQLGEQAQELSQLIKEARRAI